MVSGQSPFTLALDSVHFPYASEFMAAVILTAVLSCLNSSFYIASRVLFVLASRGDAPRWLVKTNASPRAGPGRAACKRRGLGRSDRRNSFAKRRVCLHGERIRRDHRDHLSDDRRVPDAHAAARERAGAPPPTLPMWFFPWLSYVAVAGMVMVLVAMAFTPSHRAEFWTSTISIAVVLLAYLVFRRGRASVPSMAPAVRQE